MNTKMIRYILAKMMGVEALLLLLPAIVAIIYGEKREVIAFLIPIVILAFLFLLLGRKKPEKSTIYGRDGMMIVPSAWLLWSIFGALPFVISGAIPSYIDAFFETVSGFTTTGSTILTDIEALPQSMHFWRAFTHWIGGMGVLVFVMVLTSLDRKNTMHLMRAEVPGPEKDKLVPKMTDTARILYGMYFVLTVIEIILLLFGGMNLFDSMIHAFSTAGTGGFSNYAASVGHFNSAYIDYVIAIFMILFGVNFNLYYLLLLKEFKVVFKNEELRTYLGIIAVAAVIITLNIAGQYGSVADAFRYALFQIGGIITTTGFATADYCLWPMLSQCILLFLMVCGACASSTGGGIKVSRVIVIFKSIKKEIKQMVHPKSVNVIRVNGKKMDQELVKNIYIYMISYVVIMIVSVLLIAINNMDFGTTFTSVLTTMNNVGPGIGGVGPTGSFADFSPFSKLVFCFDMLAGRLEIFPFLMFLTAFRWRKSF